jgi:methionyl-tRNA synthetase
MEMLDEYATAYEDMALRLNSSHEEFIRTTDQIRHWPTAQDMWKKMLAKGDLYKKKYGGFYCEGCEAYLLEKDLDTEGNCPDHKKKPTYIEEENYFFALSKYSKELEKLISSDQIRIIPEFRKNETLSFLRE